MRPQLRTCLLLLVGLLAAPSPTTGAAIASRGVRALSNSGSGAGPSDEEPTVDVPRGKAAPETSRLRNGTTGSVDRGRPQASGAPLGAAPATAAGAAPNASPGVARQAGPPEPADELGPLLDVGELAAFDFKKAKTTPAPSTVASAATSAPVPVTPSGRSEVDKDLSSQLAQMLKGILEESAARGQPTPQPAREEQKPQRPPLGSTGGAATVDDFLPELEGALEGVLATQGPAQPQTPRTAQMPPPPSPKVPDTAEHLKHILPTLEETIGSILKDSEAKLPAATSRPKVNPVRPATADIGRPSKPDVEEQLKHILPSLEEAIGSIMKDREFKTPVTPSRPEGPTLYPTRPATRRPLKSEDEEHLKHILPTLEETIGSILKDSEAKLIATTSRPQVTPLPPAMADTGRPSKPDVEEQLKDILPSLEEAIGSILKDREVKVPATTSRPEEPAVFPTRPPTVRPLKSDDEEHLKHILPALEEVLGGILENGEAKVQTTTARPVPTTARPVATDAKAQFSAVMPQLEEAIRAVLDEAARQQQAALEAQSLTAATSAWRPTMPTANDSGFAKFMPELERVFEDILRNRKPENSAAVASTVKTPVLPATASTKETQSLQKNLVETVSSSSQPVKSASQDVEVPKGKTPVKQP